MSHRFCLNGWMSAKFGVYGEKKACIRSVIMTGRVTRSGRGVVEAGVSTPTDGQRMQGSVLGAGEYGQGAKSSIGFEGSGLSLWAKVNRLTKKDLLDIMMQLMSKGGGDEDEDELEDEEDVEKLVGERVEVFKGARSKGVGVEVHPSLSEVTTANATNDEGSNVLSEGELPKVTFDPEKVLCEVLYGKHFPVWSFQFMLQMYPTKTFRGYDVQRVRIRDRIVIIDLWILILDWISLPLCIVYNNLNYTCS